MEITVGIVILISSLILGICLIFSGTIQMARERCVPVIEYRFVPRTFEEETKEPININDIYNQLFSHSNL
jgi:hypothetical protein